MVRSTEDVLEATKRAAETMKEKDLNEVTLEFYQIVGADTCQVRIRIKR